MKKLALILSVLCVFLVSSVFAGQIILEPDRANDLALISDGITNRTHPSLKFKCTVGSLEASDISTERGDFTSIQIPGFHGSEVIGAPNLPVMNRLVEVPVGARLDIRVISKKEKEYTFDELKIAHKIMPLQPPHPKDGRPVEFAFDPGAYIMEGYRQEKLARVIDLGIMRDRRLALVKIAPIAYNPTENKLKVYNDVVVELTLKGASLSATSELKRKYSTPYFDVLARRVMVPKSLMTRSSETRGPQTYVIISDPMFREVLTPFITWKTQQGFIVDVAYTDNLPAAAEVVPPPPSPVPDGAQKWEDWEYGEDIWSEATDNTSAPQEAPAVKALQDNIKAYIARLYNNPVPSKPAPSFILFVGDHEQVPAFRGTTGSHVTDLYYACMTPGDNLPDILYGRFSARSVDELLPQIEKTLVYEKCQMPDKSYLAGAVMIAGWDSSHTIVWGWPQIKYGVKYFFNAEHGFTNVWAYLVNGSQQYVADIKKNVSEGVGYVNYTAHGSNTSWADPSFTQTDIANLKNKDKYPLVVGNCCLTNKFDVSTCFGESWLRAKDRGAIGYIGGSNSTYWDEDLWWGNGFYPIKNPNPNGDPPTMEETGMGAYEGLFTGKYPTAAGFMVVGNLAVEESSSPRKKYYWEVYHLMGEPSLLPYLGIPAKMDAKFAPELSVNSSSLEVTAPAGAYVGVSMNGELIGAGFVDASGKASIELAGFKKTGVADIVITAQNYEPVIGTIAIK